MKRWKCSVCGYEHEGENPPEKCPLCGVPAEKFVEIKDEEEAQSAGEPLVEAKEGLSWKCSVCGYKHEGHGLPEKCPLCGVASDKFQKIEADDLPAEQETNSGTTCWKCSVCGYEHKGEVPPEKCPLCGVPSEKFVKQERGVVEPEDTATATVAEPAETVQTEKKTFLGFIRKQMLKHHVHPISVHFPNGVLPASLLFLALSIWLAIKGLELAAFFNLAFVLVNMPVVMVSGYLEWQSRYRGATTLLFKTKIASSLVVITCLTWLVGWRIINPNIIVEETPARWIYLGIAALMVGAAGIAGHLGGKLVFGSRS